MKIKSFILLFFLSANLVFAQESKINFKFIENKTQNDYTAIFTILGVKNNSTAEKIKNEISSLQGVNSFKIFYNRRCKVVISNNSNNIENQIRSILIKYNTDFDIDYLTVNDKIIAENLFEFKTINPIKDYKPNPKADLIFPSDFPKYTETGNPQLDRSNHSKAKLEWLENNPDKYKEIYGFEYLDYSDRLGKIK